MIDISLVNIITVALASSFGHCMGMCGGFILAYNSKISKYGLVKKVIFNLIYHFGRVTGYVFLGAMFGYLGGIFALTLHLRGYVYFFIGIFLIFLGVALINRGFFLKIIENQKISLGIFKYIKYLMSKDNFLSCFGLGVLNGLLPCGVVYYFAAIAIASSSALKGAFIMGLFGFFTLPSLIFASYLASIISTKYRKIFLIISSFLVIINGIYLSFMGFKVL